MIKYPRLEFVLKWASTLLVIAGAYCTSVDIVPLNKALLFTSSIGWTATGILWQQPSLWVLNGYLVLVYGYGLFLN
jgi:hypothetical protein